MFMKQATTDRLLGMLVTLATGAAILYIQVSYSGQRWARRAIRGMVGSQLMHALTLLPTHTRTASHQGLCLAAQGKRQGRATRDQKGTSSKQPPALTHSAHSDGTVARS